MNARAARTLLLGALGFFLALAGWRLGGPWLPAGGGDEAAAGTQYHAIARHQLAHGPWRLRLAQFRVFHDIPDEELFAWVERTPSPNARPLSNLYDEEKIRKRPASGDFVECLDAKALRDRYGDRFWVSRLPFGALLHTASLAVFGDREGSIRLVPYLSTAFLILALFFLFPGREIRRTGSHEDTKTRSFLFRLFRAFVPSREKNKKENPTDGVEERMARNLDSGRAARETKSEGSRPLPEGEGATPAALAAWSAAAFALLPATALDARIPGYEMPCLLLTTVTLLLYWRYRQGPARGEGPATGVARNLDSGRAAQETESEGSRPLPNPPPEGEGETLPLGGKRETRGLSFAWVWLAALAAGLMGWFGLFAVVLMLAESFRACPPIRISWKQRLALIAIPLFTVALYAGYLSLLGQPLSERLDYFWNQRSLGGLALHGAQTGFSATQFAEAFTFPQYLHKVQKYFFNQYTPLPLVLALGWLVLWIRARRRRERLTEAGPVWLFAGLGALVYVAAFKSSYVHRYYTLWWLPCVGTAGGCFVARTVAWLSTSARGSRWKTRLFAGGVVALLALSAGYKVTGHHQKEDRGGGAAVLDWLAKAKAHIKSDEELVFLQDWQEPPKDEICPFDPMGNVLKNGVRVSIKTQWRTDLRWANPSLLTNYQMFYLWREVSVSFLIYIQALPDERDYPSKPFYFLLPKGYKPKSYPDIVNEQLLDHPAGTLWRVRAIDAKAKTQPAK